jgi:hypothetical protein
LDVEFNWGYMKTTRKHKKTDQKEIHKSIDLIGELVELNPKIDHTIWVSAFLNISVISMKKSGLSLDECKEEIEKVYINEEEQHESH